MRTAVPWAFTAEDDGDSKSSTGPNVPEIDHRAFEDSVREWELLDYHYYTYVRMIRRPGVVLLAGEWAAGILLGGEGVGQCGG